MTAKKDAASNDATKKLMAVLKEKKTQLKKKTKEEAALKKSLLAMEQAQRGLYSAKKPVTVSKAVKKKAIKKHKEGHHNVR